MDKPHYFELVMRSVSEGVPNQDVVLVREYAVSPGQLTKKQMDFTKAAAVPITQAVIDAMDQMSMPLQQLGEQEMIAEFEKFSKGKGNSQ